MALLNEKEKRYLLNIIKPFKHKVKYIYKREESVFRRIEYIVIVTKDGDCGMLPLFKENNMFKGMKVNQEYSLEELGLVEKPKFKFKFGDLVKVVSNDYTYDTFEQWFELTNNQSLKENWKFGDLPAEESGYVVIACSTHPSSKRTNIYAIKDSFKQVHLIDERGLELAK